MIDSFEVFFDWNTKRIYLTTLSFDATAERLREIANLLERLEKALKGRWDELSKYIGLSAVVVVRPRLVECQVGGEYCVLPGREEGEELIGACSCFRDECLKEKSCTVKKYIKLAEKVEFGILTRDAVILL